MIDIVSIDQIDLMEPPFADFIYAGVGVGRAASDSNSTAMRVQEGANAGIERVQEGANAGVERVLAIQNNSPTRSPGF
jgi:hypothetical protein